MKSAPTALLLTLSLLASSGCVWTVLADRLLYPPETVDSSPHVQNDHHVVKNEHPTRFVEVVCSHDGQLVAKAVEQSDAEWRCAMDPDCEVRCIELEPEPDAPRYSKAASDLCPDFGTMERSAQMHLLHDQNLAWAEAYDLSPDQTWCITNDDALWDQAEAFEKACASGVPGSADKALGEAYERCDALGD